MTEKRPSFAALWDSGEITASLEFLSEFCETVRTADELEDDAVDDAANCLGSLILAVGDYADCKDIREAIRMFERRAKGISLTRWVQHIEQFVNRVQPEIDRRAQIHEQRKASPALSEDDIPF